jgi:hypothetical protein
LDKAPSLGLPFFHRVVIPGTAVVVALWPLIARALDLIGISGDARGLVFAGALVFAGFLIASLDDPIYEFLEGRRGWPAGLKQWSTQRHQKSVTDLLERAQDRSDPEYAERWSTLRQYPTEDDGTPTAKAPTRLGNILASFEQYPGRRYGMDGVFYWPRLWMKLSKDDRTDIDDAWAAADSLVYLTGGFVITSWIYLVLAAAREVALLFRWPLLVDLPTGWMLVCALLALMAAVLAYHFALAPQVRNGEAFMSAFDLNRGALRTLALPTTHERDASQRLLQALLYGSTPSPAGGWLGPRGYLDWSARRVYVFADHAATFVHQLGAQVVSPTRWNTNIRGREPTPVDVEEIPATGLPNLPLSGEQDIRSFADANCRAGAASVSARSERLGDGTYLRREAATWAVCVVTPGRGAACLETFTKIAEDRTYANDDFTQPPLAVGAQHGWVCTSG